MAHAVKAGTALLEQETPSTYTESLASPHAAEWAKAMKKELSTCEQKGVWTLVPRSSLPAGTNVIPVRWVFKRKLNERGEPVEFKARLTPKGFKQKAGEDYHEVFARTGLYKSMRVGLSITAALDNELDQMDVPAAFLNAELEEDVYMELPQGYTEGHEGMVCKLNKALYGLKQAPRSWHLKVSGFIRDKLGFTPTVSDPCLFFKRSRTQRLMLLFLFVDDFQASYNSVDKEEWDELKQLLVAEYDTKDMGPSTWILGMRIARDRVKRIITLDQEVYITKALEKYNFTQCRTVSTPESVGADLVLEHGDAPRVDIHEYMMKVGTLLYAAISTRPDIAHAVFRCTRKMQSPDRSDMLAVNRVFRYLAGTKAMGLTFGGTVPDSVDAFSVSAYADADWANDRLDRKSVTGWIVRINNDPVSWASKKQRTVALSTCEAELYAESAAVQEVLWYRDLFRELGLKVNTPSTIYGDNQSTITISKNGVKTERTKHIDTRYHFITENVENGTIRLQWVDTNNQQADIFTKALSAPKFVSFRQAIMYE